MSPIPLCLTRKSFHSIIRCALSTGTSEILYFTLRFAAGKGTALVVDVGKDTASVTPVVDGFVLRKGAS